MADGSVTIGVSLDTTFFIHSLENIEARVNGLSSSLSTILSDSLNNKTVLESAEIAFGKIENAAVSAAKGISDSFSSSATESVDSFTQSSWEESGQSAAEKLASGISAGLPTIMSAVNTVISCISPPFHRIGARSEETFPPALQAVSSQANPTSFPPLSVYLRTRTTHSEAIMK